MTLKNQTNNNMKLCENEEDETNDKIKEMPLKKEPNNAIEFYDIYP